MAVPTSSSAIIVCGSLVKRGRFVNNWKLRYFELYENELVYYQHNGGKLKGRFEISEATLYEESTLTQFCFSLTNPGTGDVLFLAGDNTHSKDLWTDSLVNVIATCRRKGKKSAVSNRLVDMPEELLYSSKSSVTVKVIQCANLLDKGTGGTSNPYVSITLGNSNFKTTTRGWCCNPQWGMMFDMDFDLTTRYLRIDVFHDAGYKMDAQLQSRKDDFLGCVQLPTLPFIAGYSHKGWYQLRKRSNRSHVGGSIELEIMCTMSPRASYEPYSMYHRIRMLPELRTTIATAHRIAITGDASGSKGKRFESKLCSEEMRKYLDEPQHCESFPFQLPPIESELFEDFAVKVSLLSTSAVCQPDAGSASPDNRMILIDGIVILTNYRLIFVSLTRLSNTIDSVDDNEMLSCDSNAEAESMNFSTHIFLSNIMEVVLASGTDLGISGISGLSDVLRIKVSDGRKLSLVFHDSGSSVYASTNANPGASANTSTANTNTPRQHSIYADGGDFVGARGSASGGGDTTGSNHARAMSNAPLTGLSGLMKMRSKLMNSNVDPGSSAPVTQPSFTGNNCVSVGVGVNAGGYNSALHNCDFLSTMNYILSSLAKNKFSMTEANGMSRSEINIGTSSDLDADVLEQSDFLSLQHLLVVCTKMDADDTEEGPPCSRIHQRLFYRVSSMRHSCNPGCCYYICTSLSTFTLDFIIVAFLCCLLSLFLD